MFPQLGNLNMETNVLKELATQLSKLFSSSNNINSIDEHESQFIDNEIPHINKLRSSKNQYSKFPPYYPQNTPPDLLFEEKS